MPTLAPTHNPRETKKLTKRRESKTRAESRLYATNHPVWRRIRADQLRREPLCRECGKKGRLEPATVVDHINQNTHDNSAENLQSLCKPCHDHKTGIETGFQREPG